MPSTDTSIDSMSLINLTSVPVELLEQILEDLRVPVYGWSKELQNFRLTCRAFASIGLRALCERSESSREYFRADETDSGIDDDSDDYGDKSDNDSDENNESHSDGRSDMCRFNTFLSIAATLRYLYLSDLGPKQADRLKELYLSRLWRLRLPGGEWPSMALASFLYENRFSPKRLELFTVALGVRLKGFGPSVNWHRFMSLVRCDFELVYFKSFGSTLLCPTIVPFSERSLLFLQAQNDTYPLLWTSALGLRQGQDAYGI